MNPAHESFRNLIELVRQRAQQAPQRLAFTYLDAHAPAPLTLARAELDRRACAVGAQLQALAARGARAILLYSSGIASVDGFFGALYAGLIPVPVVPPRPGQPPISLLNILRDAQADLVLTTRSMLAYVQSAAATAPGLEQLRWIATDELAAQAPPVGWEPVAPQPEDLALLMYTSGSTSQPKGVMLSHANLLYHMQAARELFRPHPDEKMVGWMPLHHVGGLVGGVLDPLYCDIEITLLSPLDVLERPAIWLEAISRLRAAISSGPNFGYQLCVDRITDAQAQTLDLRAWRLAFNGAEPVQSATLDRFAAKFAPAGFRREAFYPAYGLSETSAICTFGLGSPAVLTLDRKALQEGTVRVLEPGSAGQTLVSCGSAPTGTTVRIVDPVTCAECAPDRVGEIWVKGPGVALGYWNRPDATEETFQAHLANGEGPYLRTGDLGFVYNGELYPAGRLKDLIIVRGRNYYAQDVEDAVAAAHPGLQRGGGAAFGVTLDGSEEIVVMHELKPDATDADTEEVAAAMRRAAATTLDVPLYAILLVAPNSLPRTGSGKIQRYLCRAEFLRLWEMNAESGLRA